MTPGTALRALASSQRGTALPLALLVLALFPLVGFALVALGMTEVSIASNWRGYTEVFYAAEAGLASGIVSLRTLLADAPSPTDGQLAGIAAPALSSPTVSFAGFSVRRALAAPPYSHITTFTSGPYAGLKGVVTDYAITAETTGFRGAVANLSQVFRYIQIPLFQFGVFYGKGVDLEIAPGPVMTFNGRVHANSNIYVVANTGLRFDSALTTPGKILRYLKRDAPINRYNNPQIKDASGIYRDLDFDHESNVGLSGAWSPTDWKNQAMATFGGKVNDKAMGVAEIIPPIPELFRNPASPGVVAHQIIERPQPGDSTALLGAKLYSQADLRIVDGIATDRGGGPVPLPAGVITTRSFFDKRENRVMTVTQVDIGALRASGLAPANGVLYVARTGGTGDGIRLVNGSQLPSQGLSVVSENPVYVQGDYNTVDKVPAAVLADAITVLSNNWAPNNSDAKGDQVTDNRPASNTTVNAAFALGPSAESQAGQGNGQLENVIRFLENWSGRTLTYSGSIVSLWHSQQATGPWRCCGSGGTQYYRPPNRNWGYDPLFDTTPPPGTPSGVIMAVGPWSKK